MFEIQELLWDEWNIAHIKRHDITQDEVEQACRGEYVYWETHTYRIMVVGETDAGRLIAIVLGDKGEGRYYPITARSASRKERRRYADLRGGEQAA